MTARSSLTARRVRCNGHGRITYQTPGGRRITRACPTCHGAGDSARCWSRGLHED